MAVERLSRNGVAHLQAVLLDLDGLMLDTEVLARAAWQQAAAELGCELTEAQYLQLVGRRDDDCERELVRWFGPGFPLDTFRHRWHIAWDTLTEPGIAVKPGLVELLDWVEERRLPMAVATSSYASSANRKLGKAGIGHRIPCIVTGDQVRAAKPAPDIFIHAARCLGVHDANCLVLEDSDAGIAAAHAAGMRAVMVPDLKPPSSESLVRAWRVCKSLYDVRELLAATEGT
jgi:beta-phosphoglucomutase-like phosphatase (HAD superfamily)